ncbi:phosphoglycolate phosphatase-like HAD superfamily hydrolase [Tenacibaculum adriaticum]|uniref:phosphoglycolate phosphatase n=1 Tax=Tenacibaculum adriaticum TaxID=413713 RepID=A0A5S5DU29_9FLAO|nr:HAD family hydrolase [Tenacibaculum adriaticum]TYP99460.1 phosphoglycolate phosphatase-like HAD superfamily hydrolase [Tenacibaculum adriaticum]
MKKENLIVLDIDDTLTQSEEKHTDSLLFAMKYFGITKVDTDWRNYKNATDSYIFKDNYEKTYQNIFSFDLIEEFEKVMTERFLTYPNTTEVEGAKNTVNYLLNETNYAVCFATGSIHQPALLKLLQADINFVPEVLSSSNYIFTREEIVKSAIKEAKEYYEVSHFENIISFGDGLWDATTAKNLGLHFVGVNTKNVEDFKKQNVKYHINDWTEFDLNKTEEMFNLNL